MKTSAFFPIIRWTGLLWLLLTAGLSNAEPLPLIQSDAKSNIAVCCLFTQQVPATTNLIYYMFSNVGTNEMTVYLPPHGHHVCKVEMVNEKGEALHKTKLAMEIESRFYETTNVLTYKERISKTGWRQLSPYTLGVGGGGTILELYRPDQLFEIDQPGKYTLTLTFQVMEFIRYNTGDGISLARAITLPPIKIELDAPTKASGVPQK